MSDTPSKAKRSRKKNKKQKEENEPESEPESEPEPEPTSSSKDENTADEIDFRKLVTSMLSDAKKQQKIVTEAAEKALGIKNEANEENAKTTAEMLSKRKQRNTLDLMHRPAGESPAFPKTCAYVVLTKVNMQQDDEAASFVLHGYFPNLVEAIRMFVDITNPDCRMQFCNFVPKHQSVRAIFKTVQPPRYADQKKDKLHAYIAYVSDPLPSMSQTIDFDEPVAALFETVSAATAAAEDTHRATQNKLSGAETHWTAATKQLAILDNRIFVLNMLKDLSLKPAPRKSRLFFILRKQALHTKDGPYVLDCLCSSFTHTLEKFIESCTSESTVTHSMDVLNLGASMNVLLRDVKHGERSKTVHCDRVLAMTTK